MDKLKLFTASVEDDYEFISMFSNGERYQGVGHCRRNWGNILVIKLGENANVSRSRDLR